MKGHHRTEPLEPRTLLAVTPIGSEFPVDAAPLRYATPAAAADADGGSVVTWARKNTENGPFSIYARRISAGGAPAGPIITVGGAGTWVHEIPPAVATGDDGDFVVAWVREGAGTGESRPRDVLMRRYAADGTPRDAERLVASLPATASYTHAVVAMDADGDYVITYRRTSGNTQWIAGRRYAADGAAAADGTFVVGYVRVRRVDPVTDQVSMYARVYEAGAPQPPAAVVGRHVFYNRSTFDGNDDAPGVADDGAIATDKAALLPGQATSFSNVTSFRRGINGVMVDIANLPAGSVLTQEDFDFGGALRPWGITVRPGAGADGSARVTLVWADYSPGAETATMAVANGWLRVTVRATADTGLALPDVFSFGNLIGETGDATAAGGTHRVNALDAARLRAAMRRPAADVTSPFDFNRDGVADALDLNIQRQCHGTSLAPPPPPAPALSTPPRSRRSTYDLLTA